MAYRWTFRKNHLKLKTFCGQSTTKYNVIGYDVRMDLQKKSFIEPAESCPDLLKMALWKKLGRLVQKYRTAI